MRNLIQQVTNKRVKIIMRLDERTITRAFPF